MSEQCYYCKQVGINQDFPDQDHLRTHALFEHQKLIPECELKKTEIGLLYDSFRNYRNNIRAQILKREELLKSYNSVSKGERTRLINHINNINNNYTLNLISKSKALKKIFLAQSKFDTQQQNRDRMTDGLSRNLMYLHGELEDINEFMRINRIIT